MKDKLIILTTEYEVYEYKAGTLSQIQIPEKVIDISGNYTSVVYQTENEKTYVSGMNAFGELGTGDTNPVGTPVLVTNHGENTYGIGAGYNNTYIIENTGNVYASRKQ